MDVFYIFKTRVGVVDHKSLPIYGESRSDEQSGSEAAIIKKADDR
jgi:hypothetical protein